MGTRAAAILAVVMVTGCGGYGAETFTCSSSAQCAGGTCDTSVGFCTQPDSMCASMQRYTDHSGSLSGTCVGGGMPLDASIPDARPDAPPDAPRTCFATNLLNNVNICLQMAPTAPRTFGTATALDTDNTQMCTPVMTGGNGLCVIAATTISVDTTLRATGVKPLVLIARDTITINATGVIDVASHRGAIPDIGAGGDPGTCLTGPLPTLANGTSGGGAGGSFAGLGGKGGNGGGNGGQPGGVGGMPAAIVTSIVDLRGGCPGQQGQGGGASKGAPGHGGGAVLLIAGISITVAGKIHASGAGGIGGVSGEAGGGGGGAGGMIVLDAPAVTNTGLILANGGGGGEGAGTTAPQSSGNPGADPSAVTAASGGTLGTTNGADGGAGSSNVAANGTDGVNSTAGPGNGGGGGGGGGAGVIKVIAGANLGTNASPPPSSP